MNERYERLALQGLPMSPTVQNAMRDLREELGVKNTEILKYQSDIGCMQEDLQTLRGQLDDKEKKLLEMNQRYEHAVQHGRNLQQDLNVARAPEVIAFSGHGTCYHLPGCNHLQGGGRNLRKCKTCLP